MFWCRCNRKFAVQNAEISPQNPEKSHEKSHKDQGNLIVKECEGVY